METDATAIILTLKQDVRSDETICIPKDLLRMTGTANSAIMLEWFIQNANADDPYETLIITDREWYELIDHDLFSPRYARERLERLGFIFVDVKFVEGANRRHFRVNWVKIYQLYGHPCEDFYQPVRENAVNGGQQNHDRGSPDVAQQNKQECGSGAQQNDAYIKVLKEIPNGISLDRTAARGKPDEHKAKQLAFGDAEAIKKSKQTKKTSKKEQSPEQIAFNQQVSAMRYAYKQALRGTLTGSEGHLTQACQALAKLGFTADDISAYMAWQYQNEDYFVKHNGIQPQTLRARIGNWKGMHQANKSSQAAPAHAVVGNTTIREVISDEEYQRQAREQVRRLREYKQREVSR